MQAKAAGAIAPFAALLRTLRERAGLTQEELAERAGLTAHGVSALERGVRSRPYPHTVRSLADALDLTADQRAALLRAASGGPMTEGGGEPQPAADGAPALRGLPAQVTPLLGR